MVASSFSPTRRLMISSAPASVSKCHFPSCMTMGMGKGHLSVAHFESDRIRRRSCRANSQCCSSPEIARGHSCRRPRSPESMIGLPRFSEYLEQRAVVVGLRRFNESLNRGLGCFKILRLAIARCAALRGSRSIPMLSGAFSQSSRSSPPPPAATAAARHAAATAARARAGAAAAGATKRGGRSRTRTSRRRAAVVAAAGTAVAGIATAGAAHVAGASVCSPRSPAPPRRECWRWRRRDHANQPCRAS